MVTEQKRFQAELLMVFIESLVGFQKRNEVKFGLNRTLRRPFSFG